MASHAISGSHKFELHILHLKIMFLLQTGSNANVGLESPSDPKVHVSSLEDWVSIQPLNLESSGDSKGACFFFIGSQFDHWTACGNLLRM